jgi:hypothetical protein
VVGVAICRTSSYCGTFVSCHCKTQPIISRERLRYEMAKGHAVCGWRTHLVNEHVAPLGL